MAIHDLTADHLGFHESTISALTPDTQRNWGEMTVERMMRHLRVTIDLTLTDPAEKQVKVLAPPVIRNVVGFVFFDVFTNWPKGKMKSSAQFVPEEAGSFEDEQRQLIESCAEFARRCEADPSERCVHPLTGLTPLKRIAHLHGVHMNHHYRQFGAV